MAGTGHGDLCHHVLDALGGLPSGGPAGGRVERHGERMIHVPRLGRATGADEYSGANAPRSIRPRTLGVPRSASLSGGRPTPRTRARTAARRRTLRRAGCVDPPQDARTFAEAVRAARPGGTATARAVPYRVHRPHVARERRPGPPGEPQRRLTAGKPVFPVVPHWQDAGHVSRRRTARLRPGQDLPPGARGRRGRPDGPAGGAGRAARAQRRRQDHHAADVPRGGQPGRRHRRDPRPPAAARAQRGDGRVRLRRRLPATARPDAGHRVSADVRPAGRPAAAGSGRAGGPGALRGAPSLPSHGYGDVQRPEDARRHRQGGPAPAGPARARRADRVAGSRRGAAGPHRVARDQRRLGHRAAGHQPQHGRGGAAVRAGGVPVLGPGRRRRHRLGDRRALRPQRSGRRVPAPGTAARPARGGEMTEVFEETELYAGAAASFWRIMAIARRHAYVLQRSPHRLFDVVMWPAVDVVLFGSIGIFAAGRATSGASQVALFLLVGVVLWHVVYQAQIALATGFLEETWSRSLLSLMVTPMREWEYLAGVAIFGLVKLFLGVGAVALIAWVAYAFSIISLGFGLIPVAALLLATGWAIALFVVGLVLRFGSGAEALAWGILFVVMPLSGTFYPVSALPGLLRPIGEVLPTTHALAAA